MSCLYHLTMSTCVFWSSCGCVAGMVIKAVTPKPQGDLVNGSSELSMSPSENSLLLQYKDLIREQDRKLQELTQIIDRLTAEKSTLQVRYLHFLFSLSLETILKFMSECFWCFMVTLYTLDNIHGLSFVLITVIFKQVPLPSSGNMRT